MKSCSLRSACLCLQMAVSIYRNQQLRCPGIGARTFCPACSRRPKVDLIYLPRGPRLLRCPLTPAWPRPCVDIGPARVTAHAETRGDVTRFIFGCNSHNPFTCDKYKTVTVALGSYIESHRTPIPAHDRLQCTQLNSHSRQYIYPR